MSENVLPRRMISDNRLKTGEGVSLDVYPASPVVRAVALLVDVWIYASVCGGVLLLMAVLGFLRTVSVTRIAFIGTVVCAFLVLPMLVEFVTRGRSLGKWAFHLQVVRDDGGPVTMRHIAMRAVCGLVEIYTTMGSLAFVSALISKNSKRLGDMAAGTMVIRLPQHAHYAPLVMPPELARWADEALLTDPGSDVRAYGLYLMRTLPTMQPAQRVDTAHAYAHALLSYVSPAPPTDDPERFIAAFLVTLRNREYARDLKRRERDDALTARAGSIPFDIESA